MKRIIYIIAFACTLAAVACHKELESSMQPTESNKHKTTIHANLGEITKTSYANEITFSWTEGDKIGVWTTDGENYEKVIFEAESSGPSVDFTGELSEGYYLVPNGKAFYPDGDATPSNNFASTFDGSNYAVTLGSQIDIDLNNPMSVIPLVGTNDGSGNYSFKTATGIMKVTFNRLQSSTIRVVIHHSNPGLALNGAFSLENDEVKITNSTTASCLKYLKVNGLAEGSSGVFYFPIPTGEIPSNLYIGTLNTNFGWSSFEITTKPITITRNKITNINVALNGGSEWSYLGMGKFVDNYTFAQRDNKAGYMVDVPVYYKVDDIKKYRIIDPYGASWTEFGLTNAGSTKTLSLEVKKSGDTMVNNESSITVTNDDLVYFYGGETSEKSDNYIYTGYVYTGNSSVRIIHPYPGGSDEAHSLKSYVKLYQNDGRPAVIQLSYKYDNRSSITWLDNVNNVIYIIFPGCNPAAAIMGEYKINGTNNTFTIDLSDNPEKGNLMITGCNFWNLSGSIYGNYEDGNITIPRGQYFAHTNGNYYSFYMGDYTQNGVITSNDLVLHIDSAKPISDKSYTGSVLVPEINGFGIGVATSLTNGEVTNMTVTSMNWGYTGSGGTAVYMYKK